VPRNRTVRLAVLGSSVQRAATAKYPSRARTALKRRVVVGVLVLLSLVMITLSVRAREDGGGLDNLQGAAATVLHPVQVGLERVFRPFRDLYGYVSGLVDAKAEADRLRTDLRVAEQQAARNQLAAQELEQVQRLLDYRDSPRFPDDYGAVATAVVGYPPSQFVQELVIAAGEADGIRVHDPVVNGDGLVGRVSKVSRRTAQVTLLTDDSSAVSAVVVGSPKAAGIVRRERAGGDLLLLEHVTKSPVVREGDKVVTAGSVRGDVLRSLYPRGIPIGKVVAVTQSDIDLYKRIQVDPAVDFDAVDSVIVLVPRRAAR
jgi:rod shape-determining protein MreC